MLDNNNIGHTGVKYLSNGNWLNLNILNLSIFINLRIDRNNIGYKGIEYLVKCKWNNVSTLNLGIILLNR